MTKTFAWTRAEICKLFDVVAEYKKNNKPLLQAFRDFAACFARKPASVRNFYYAQLKVFESSPKLCQEWGIQLDCHKKNLASFFTEEELESTMTKIDNLVQQGQSVRSACKILANGDATQMLRLQNKYHAQKQKSSPKVLVMPSKNSSLSESEINSLLLGLIKLVRKSATETASKNFETKVRAANFELRRLIKTLAEKEREVEDLRHQFELLVTEKHKLREEIQVLRSQNVDLMKTKVNNEKMSGLKSYINKLSESPLIKS